LLTKNDIEVIGISRRNKTSFVDITNQKDVEKLIRNEKPNFVFHLAAISALQHNLIFENQKTIVDGTINILEAVKNYSIETKVFISGSGLQFENKGFPIKEDDKFDPKDAYSMSRIHSVYSARFYRKLGIKVYVGYFYNHDSPLRGENHMTKKIFSLAQRVSKGSSEIMSIGDLGSKKEYGYAKEVVEAVWMFVNQDQVFEVNIGTGVSYSIKDWLEICFGHYNLDWKNSIVSDNNYKSPYKILVSDNNLMINTIGYEFKTNIEELFDLMLNYKN
jgi:GDPmannose 4,6-dehydratase